MNHVTMALVGGIFTWGLTAIGSATVFFMKKMNQKALNLMLGLATGIMLAASFWSLLLPAHEMNSSWLPIGIGFLLGTGFLFFADRLINKTNKIKGKDKSVSLLILAITLHNIPEGMAFGVAFACAADKSALSSAIALTIGIGLQNFPEGAAVSMPLRRTGMSRGKSFFIGQLSAVVEPIFAVIGALLVSVAAPLLPYLLSFAAGAMIWVVIDELIPESFCSESGKTASVGAVCGFAIMTIMDIAL